MASTGESFQRLVAQLDYPMFIATVAADGERAGCLIGFATQCSIHPPRFLAGLSDKNRTFRVAQRADSMAIHLVPENAAELAELFGGETGDEVDKFERCEWHAGPGPGRLPEPLRRPRPRAGRLRRPHGLCPRAVRRRGGREVRPARVPPRQANRPGARSLT
jgi:hypothetical protein